MLRIDKSFIDEYIDSNIDNLWTIAKYIHENPEIALEEIMACNILSDFLERNGFVVEKSVGGLKTSFVGEYVHKESNTTVAVIAEYDALPYLGHACGHNLIAASAMGTAIAAKEFMIKHDIAGKLKIIGTPAEESVGGKIIMLENGVFDDIDAVFLLHPTSGVTKLAGECMSFDEMTIEYRGVSAHAGSHPDDGINALDAATLFMNAVGLQRQQMKKTCNISYYVENGGKTTSLIPDFTSIKCNTYSFNYKDLARTTDRVKEIAKGISIATGCEMELTYNPGYAGRIPNEVLANACKNELQELDEPVMDGLVSDYGAEDLGNVSRVIPICNLYPSIYKKEKISNHTEQFRELAKSEAGKDCVAVGSKAMARTIIELFVNRELIDEAKKELKLRLAQE